MMGLVSMILGYADVVYLNTLEDTYDTDYFVLGRFDRSDVCA